MFVQCTLTRKIPESEKGSSETQVSWIPKKFAKKGDVLKLKENGKWTDGWVVERAGAESDEPPDYRKEIRTHRKKTGDSLPKENGPVA